MQIYKTYAKHMQKMCTIGNKYAQYVTNMQLIHRTYAKYMQKSELTELSYQIKFRLSKQTETIGRLYDSKQCRRRSLQGWLHVSGLQYVG